MNAWDDNVLYDMSHYESMSNLNRSVGITLSHRCSWSHRRSKTTEIDISVIVLAIDHTLAACEDTGPNATTYEEENEERNETDSYKCRSHRATVAPAINSIVNFSVDRTYSPRVFIRLIRKLLSKRRYPEQGQHDNVTGITVTHLSKTRKNCHRLDVSLKRFTVQTFFRLFFTQTLLLKRSKLLNGRRYWRFSLVFWQINPRFPTYVL